MAISEGLRTAGTLARLQEFEDRKRELEDQLATQPANVVRLHPRLAEVYRAKVADLAEALKDPTRRQEAVQSVRGLIDGGVMHPREKGLEFELIGDIAGMVALAQGPAAREGNDVRAALRSSVKVLSMCRFAL